MDILRQNENANDCAVATTERLRDTRLRLRCSISLTPLLRQLKGVSEMLHLSSFREACFDICPAAIAAGLLNQRIRASHDLDAHLLHRVGLAVAATAA